MATLADRDLDLLFATSGHLNHVVFFNDGLGYFQRKVEPRTSANEACWAIAAGDFDGDGDVDAVGGAQIPIYFENDGTGHFTEITTGRFTGASFGQVNDIAT